MREVPAVSGQVPRHRKLWIEVHAIGPQPLGQEERGDGGKHGDVLALLLWFVWWLWWLGMREGVYREQERRRGSREQERRGGIREHLTVCWIRVGSVASILK
jgi:hypothetical protein